jgi:hypothetical protein
MSGVKRFKRTGHGLEILHRTASYRCVDNSNTYSYVGIKALLVCCFTLSLGFFKPNSEVKGHLDTNSWIREGIPTDMCVV